MKKLVYLYSGFILIVASSCSQQQSNNMVLVKGGSFKYKKSNYYGKNLTLLDFYIGKYMVTQKEWEDVMGIYEGKIKADNLPVDSVGWYNCVEYCNKRSEKEGLNPYYIINKYKKDPENNIKFDNLKWTITINKDAEGYRLPTEAEWEYAASGGQLSKNYIYIGSDDIKEVAWYWQNAGDRPLSGMWNFSAVMGNHNKTHPVGLKKPNELGLFDMPGNVREWCWDWHKYPRATSFAGRTWKGGCWMCVEICGEPSFSECNPPNGKTDMGFRICRTKL